MIQRLGMLCLMLSIAAFGKDAAQPVKKASMELGVGYGYAVIPGYYDASGKYSNWDQLFGKDTSLNPVLYGIPMRAKYGLGGGFDVKFDWDAIFSNKDAGSLRGMGQPKLGLKYAGPIFGLYGNVTAPFATGNVDNGKLRTYLELGGLARKKLTHFRFTGTASYTEILETGNLVRGSFKPEILWNNHFSTYSTVSFYKFTAKDAYAISLTPGLRTDLTEDLVVDIAGSASVTGHSALAGWALAVIFYQTIGY